MSAQRSNAGPISASCLSTAERPDRPILRTFQRHPANQVPDAQLAAKVLFYCVLVELSPKCHLVSLSLGYDEPATVSRRDSEADQSTESCWATVANESGRQRNGLEHRCTFASSTTGTIGSQVGRFEICPRLTFCTPLYLSPQPSDTFSLAIAAVGRARNDRSMAD